MSNMHTTGWGCRFRLPSWTPGPASSALPPSRPGSRLRTKKWSKTRLGHAHDSVRQTGCLQARSFDEGRDEIALSTAAFVVLGIVSNGCLPLVWAAPVANAVVGATRHLLLAALLDMQ